MRYKKSKVLKALAKEIGQLEQSEMNTRKPRIWSFLSGPSVFDVYEYHRLRDAKALARCIEMSIGDEVELGATELRMFWTSFLADDQSR